jgi:hypothetical protein
VVPDAPTGERKAGNDRCNDGNNKPSASNNVPTVHANPALSPTADADLEAKLDTAPPVLPHGRPTRSHMKRSLGSEDYPADDVESGRPRKRARFLDDHDQEGRSKMLAFQIQTNAAFASPPVPVSPRHVLSSACTAMELPRRSAFSIASKIPRYNHKTRNHKLELVSQGSSVPRVNFLRQVGVDTAACMRLHAYVFVILHTSLDQPII